MNVVDDYKCGRNQNDLAAGVLKHATLDDKEFSGRMHLSVFGKVERNSRHVRAWALCRANSESGLVPFSFTGPVDPFNSFQANEMDALMKEDTTAKKEVTKPKPLPAPNSDFYHLAETLPAEELAIVKRVREFMETKVAPVITEYWVEDEFPFDLLPASEGTGHRRRWHEGLRLRRRKSALLLGLIQMEIATNRPVFLHLPRCAQRTGDGLYLYRWVGRAEAEMAAADGALRQDRLLRPDRAAGRFRRVWRTSDNRKTRRRYLDS